MPQASAKNPTEIEMKMRSRIDDRHLVAVPGAKSLQALLRRAPPALFRSDHQDAAGSQGLEQGVRGVAGEEDQDLSGRHPQSHLLRLLAKHIDRDRRLLQFE